MSNKILLSNSGSFYEISEESVKIDNNGALSASSLTINTGSFIGQSGILRIEGGQIKTVQTGSEVYIPGNNWSGSALIYSGSSFGPHKSLLSAFTSSGDISGSISSNIQVTSIQNVTGGILQLNCGGTGVSYITSGSILTTAGEGPGTGSANNIIATTGSNGEWGAVNKSIIETEGLSEPIVFLYTGSYATITGGSLASTYNFTKPPGTRFMRVVCQGAGGGGARGQVTNTATTALHGCGGGGAGGYSDAIFNGSTFPNDAVTVGCGRPGRGGDSGAGANNGRNGSSSSLGPDSNGVVYLVARGGLGGSANTNSNTTPGAGGAGGIGYTRDGAAGSAGRAIGAPKPAAPAVNLIPFSNAKIIGAASGGGGGADKPSTNINKNGGDGGTIYVDNYITAEPGFGTTLAATSNGALGSRLPGTTCDSYYLNNNPITGSFPNLICAGAAGTGGAYNTNYNSYGGGWGANLTSSNNLGAGGGAAGSTFQNTTRTVEGGHGGPGYVLIICW